MSDRSARSLKRPLRIRLDWRAYYRLFCEQHGGDPVKYNGRLLFADGWGYSMTDVRGPEFPPPEDPEELLRLRVAYWSIRRKQVIAEYNYLHRMISEMRIAQSSRSVPLQQRFTWVDEDGSLKSTTANLDLNELEQGRLRWLRDDILHCGLQLEKLIGAATHE